MIQVKVFPNKKRSLISLGMLDSHGLDWSSKKGVLDVRFRDKIVLWGHKDNNLYMLEVNTICGEVHFTWSWLEMSNVWHFRLWHVNDRYMYLLDERKSISKPDSPGLDIVDLTFCKHCIMGKRHWRAFGLKLIVSKSYLIIYIVICGNPLLITHSLESCIMYHLQMITQDMCGFISSHISLSCFQLSKVSGPSWDSNWTQGEILAYG